MPRLFGRTKSKSSLTTTADEQREPERKVKKSKSFKRIRGLIKKTRSAVVGRKRQNSRDIPMDEQSIYNVDIDDRSVMTRPPDPAAAASNNTTATALDRSNNNNNNNNNSSSFLLPQKYILKVVLLLMDPETRRFELLQLEFDSLKAIVSDVLAQIPISVTEDTLRMQTYTGIVGPESLEMPPSKLLATFCKGNEVLVAVPDGIPPRECVRLARPILSDSKVITMLAASGIDPSPWKDVTKTNRKKRSTLKSKSSTGTSSSILPGQQPQKKTLSGSIIFSFLFILLGAFIMQVFHTYISAPIKPGSAMVPGTWLTKCGLLALWPSCENAYVHLDRSGVLTFYNAEKEIQWKVEGRSCPQDEKECIQGLQVLDDGSVNIGGKLVKEMIAYGHVDLDVSPWPFVETPKIRVWKK